MPDRPPPKPPRLAPGTSVPLPPPRPKQRTIPDGAPPPFDSTLESPTEPRQAAPGSPSDHTDGQRVVLTVEPPQRRQAPQIHTPPSFESPARQAEAERVIRRQGDRVEAPPESLPAPRPERPSVPPPSRGDQPWWRTAKGLAVGLPIIVTSVTGVLGGITAGVVLPIIKAVREPTEGAKVKDIAEAKAAGERCDAAVVSERKSTLAREKELADKALALDAKVSELARRVPEVKPDPSRQPAK